MSSQVTFLQYPLNAQSHELLQRWTEHYASFFMGTNFSAVEMNQSTTVYLRPHITRVAHHTQAHSLMKNSISTSVVHKNIHALLKGIPKFSCVCVYSASKTGCSMQIRLWSLRFAVIPTGRLVASSRLLSNYLKPSPLTCLRKLVSVINHSLLVTSCAGQICSAGCNVVAAYRGSTFLGGGSAVSFTA